MADIVDAMAITLAQSSVDLSDEAETAILLLEAGYDEHEITDVRHLAVREARHRRHVNAICAGMEVAHG
ncbi:MAG: hypothetical protein K0S00_4451 [Xanthobacteraceae bacterium]|jgi:hypothetical protein|nr:hypothetical protein [Xanthobacteraceae bacterium]MDF2809365.1 hypothetical protein [Microvirga sp.]